MKKNEDLGLVFDHKTYVRNNDMFKEMDNLCIDVEGNILVEDFTKYEYPQIIGKYNIKIINNHICSYYGYPKEKLLENVLSDDLWVNYQETCANSNKNKLFINNKKLFLIEYVVVQPKFMGKRIIYKNLLKMIYKNFYGNDDMTVMGFFKPIQQMKDVVEYMKYETKLKPHNNIKFIDEPMSEFDYFGIKNLYKDNELDDLNLYAYAQKLGFKQISPYSPFFVLYDLNTNLFKK